MSSALQINHLKTTLPGIYAQEEGTLWDSDYQTYFDQASQLAIDHLIPGHRNTPSKLTLEGAKIWQKTMKSYAEHYLGNAHAIFLKTISEYTVELKEALQNRESLMHQVKEIGSAAAVTVVGTAFLYTMALWALVAAQLDSKMPSREGLEFRLYVALPIITVVGIVLGYVGYRWSKSQEKAENDAKANSILSLVRDLRGIKPDQKLLYIESITNPSQAPEWLTKKEMALRQEAVKQEIARLYHEQKPSSPSVD